MKTTGKEKAYLTSNDVAVMMMVSSTTVRQWSQSGSLIAHITPGGHRRFLRRDVERFAMNKGMTLQAANNDRLRILIVDDDVQFTRFIVELLTMNIEIVEIEVAHDGFDAGQKVRVFEPDIILLDLIMPGLDGFEVCQRLKSHPTTKSIRIIAISGFDSKENVEKVLKAGAEICFSKPIQAKALLQAIGIKPEPSIRMPSDNQARGNM